MAPSCRTRPNTVPWRTIQAPVNWPYLIETVSNHAGLMSSRITSAKRAARRFLRSAFMVRQRQNDAGCAIQLLRVGLVNTSPVWGAIDDVDVYLGEQDVQAPTWSTDSSDSWSARHSDALMTIFSVPGNHIVSADVCTQTIEYSRGSCRVRRAVARELVPTSCHITAFLISDMRAYFAP